MMIKMLARCLLPHFLFECRAVKYHSEKTYVYSSPPTAPLPRITSMKACVVYQIMRTLSMQELPTTCYTIRTCTMDSLQKVCTMQSSGP